MAEKKEGKSKFEKEIFQDASQSSSSSFLNLASKQSLIKLLSWLVLFLLVTLFYWPVLIKLLEKISNDDQYSFGLLLIACIPYIVYRQWPLIKRCEWHSSWTGLIFLFFGFGLYFMGEVNTIAYLSRISIIPVIAGMLLLLGGWLLVKVLSFPLLLLFIIIPLPNFLINRLTLKLQLLSSTLAARSLSLMGLAVNLQGNIIDLGYRQLQVVEACSGLGYLFSALALGCIFCYFYQRRPWKIFLLISSLIPFSIVGNALRLDIIAIYPVFEKGFWHQVIGLVIFLLCILYLSFINWLLDYASPPLRNFDQDFSSISNEPRPYTSSSFSLFPIFLSLVLVLVLGSLIFRIGDVQPIPLKKSLDNFPLQLGVWQGQRRYIDPKMFEATGADNYLDVDYTNPEKDRVSLWIAYYENQKTGGSVHSPLACFPGSGWEIVESGIINLAPGHPVKYIVTDQGGQRLLIYYWYFQQGRWLANEYEGKLDIGYNRLISRRADGVLVRLITPESGNGPSKSRTTLTSFALLLSSILPNFIHY